MSFFLLLTVLHLLCGISMDYCKFILNVLSFVLSLIAHLFPSFSSVLHSQSIPSDVQICLCFLDIEPVSKAYVVCAKYSALYCMDLESRPSFLSICTKPQLDQSHCGTPLVSRKHGGKMPDAQPLCQFCY